MITNMKNMLTTY